MVPLRGDNEDDIPHSNCDVQKWRVDLLSASQCLDDICKDDDVVVMVLGT